MNTDELKVILSAAATIKNAGHLARAAAEFPPVEDREKARAVISRAAEKSARNSLRILAERSLSDLHKTRYIVEAHAASGLAFPALAEELFNLLAEGRPEWLSSLTSAEAAGWEAEARAIQAAAGRYYDGMPKEGGDPPTYPRIYTTKSDAALREIFSELVKEGFIAGTDEGGGDMREAFLNSFERSGKPSAGIVYNSKPRGRIIWKKRSGHGPNKAALVAFLYHNGVEAWDSWKTIADGIFGIELKADDKKKHYNTKGGPSTAYNENIRRILRARL